MTTLRVVLGDQCTAGLSSLEDLDPSSDVVLMAEVMRECTYVPHHPKKIVLILSAMRHFARALEARGVRVEYTRLDDPDNTGSFRGEVLRACARHQPSRIVVTEPGEWRVLEDMRTWHEAAGIECDIRDDTRFLYRIQDFRAWARGRGAFRMETFYRAMRLQTGLLMDGTEPEGGRWNYDPENRKPLPRAVAAPPPPRFPPDEITQDVMALVAARFPTHFGDVDGFALPVTNRDARLALADFVENRLAQFGDWQDAMRAGEGVLFHALISTSMNTGLLGPLEAGRQIHVGQDHLAAERQGDTAAGDHEERCRECRITRTKNGAPKNAVITPIGISSGAAMVRARRSAEQRKAAPNRMESGRTTR